MYELKYLDLGTVLVPCSRRLVARAPSSSIMASMSSSDLACDVKHLVEGS